MGSNIEYRFDGSVTSPNTVNAIIIPVADDQYVQVKVFAVYGTVVGGAGLGGVNDYYLFCTAHAAMGVAMIDVPVFDTIAAADLTGKIDIDALGGVLRIRIKSPTGGTNVTNWALRASVDIVDNIYYAPS